MQKVVKESKVGQKATAQLNQQFERLQKVLQAKQDALKAFKDDIEKKAPLMNEEARTEKELEYKKMLREFKEQSDDAQLEMRKAEAKVMEPILKVLEKVVTKMGESGGYSLILENNMPGLYYVAPTIDITDSVIKAYDQESAAQPQSLKTK
jgi:outer membrane protein